MKVTLSRGCWGNMAGVGVLIYSVQLIFRTWWEFHQLTRMERAAFHRWTEAAKTGGRCPCGRK